MIVDKINNVKGFMPAHEGEALTKWAYEFSIKAPIMEIGSYCGKSAMYLARGARKNNQHVFTIDHHKGSEEHQINEEYFDNEIYDFSKKRINTFPELIKNINNLKFENIVPIVSDSTEVAKNWSTDLGMVFIDGGHSIKSSMNDYNNWELKILKGGALVIHDIFENPNEGGQAPYEVYKKAIKNDYTIYERVDTIACLVKNGLIT